MQRLNTAGTFVADAVSTERAALNSAWLALRSTASTPTAKGFNAAMEVRLGLVVAVLEGVNLWKLSQSVKSDAKVKWQIRAAMMATDRCIARHCRERNQGLECGLRCGSVVSGPEGVRWRAERRCFVYRGISGLGSHERELGTQEVQHGGDVWPPIAGTVYWRCPDSTNGAVLCSPSVESAEHTLCVAPDRSNSRQERRYGRWVRVPA